MSLRSRLGAHLRSGQVSKVVYGSIIGLALILALQSHPPGVLVVVGTLLATALAVALAEVYSELLGARARASLGEQTEPVREIAADSVAVALGISFPSVFFLAVPLGLVDVGTAFALAKWTGLGLIAGYGYVAARLSGIGPARSLLQAAGVSVIAAALIGFKSLLH